MHMEGEMAGERYRLIRKLGEGGTGSTWLVLDEKLGKRWAMKICTEGRRVKEADSFREECMALRDMDSVRFPRIVEAFREKGERFLVMDWIRGITLEERILEQGTLGVKEATAVAGQLCEALRVLHQRRPPVLHLDLKPSNIMLTEEGVRLIDFGSALSGWEGLRACSGTPGYASPEQLGTAGGKADACAGVDERSDIYSLGAVLWAMLTGKRPQPGQLWQKGAPGVPKQLRRIVKRAMDPDRRKRFQSVEELAEALERARRENRRRRIAGMLKKGISIALILFAACRGAELAVNCHELWERGMLRRMDAGQIIRGLLPMLISCLWERRVAGRFKGRRSGDRRGNFWYLQEKNRLRTDKRGQVWLGIWAGIAIIILAAGPIDSLRAQEETTTKEERNFTQKNEAREAGSQTDGGRLPVVLRDQDMRKLLIKEGGICETEGPLYLEITRELLDDGAVLQIRIEGKDGDSPPRTYAFTCKKKE